MSTIQNKITVYQTQSTGLGNNFEANITSSNLVTTDCGSAIYRYCQRVFSAIEREQIKALPASDFETADHNFKFTDNFGKQIE